MSFYLPIVKPLSLVFQDFSVSVVARKRESQLALGLAHSRKLLSIDVPSLSCNIEKFLWFLGKLSGLEALSSRAGLAAVTEMDNLKTRSATGGGKNPFSFP